MWIISFLPSYVTHLLVLCSLAGIVVTSVPIVWDSIPGAHAYKLLIQLVSIAILGFGLYLEGGIANDDSWKAKVADLEVKLAKAEAKSAKVNTVIVTEYVTKKQVIREKGDTITEYIDREVKTHDNSCPIPTVVISAHNAAAKNDPSLLVAPSIKLAPKK